MILRKFICIMIFRLFFMINVIASSITGSGQRQGSTPPSTRFFQRCRRPREPRRTLYSLPALEGCPTTTLGIDGAGTRQDFYTGAEDGRGRRTRFLQSTARPRCGGRANGRRGAEEPVSPRLALATRVASSRIAKSDFRSRSSCRPIVGFSSAHV